MSHLYPEKYHLYTDDVILGRKWGWSDCMFGWNADHPGPEGIRGQAS